MLADCDEHGNLDPADVAKRITDRTFGIVVTHMWGIPADVSALRALADAHDLALLEDGSHPGGASVWGRKIGTFGRGAAFSMNGPKPLSAGEGGFILTNDDEVYYRTLLHGQYNKRCRDEIPADHRLYGYAVTGMGLKHRIHRGGGRPAEPGRLSRPSRARRARAGQPTVVPLSRLAGTCWSFFSALKSCRAWLWFHSTASPAFAVG